MKYLFIVALSLLIQVNAQWNSQGVPDNLIEDVNVTTALLRDIDRILPERGGTPVPTAHPEFFSGEFSSNIHLVQQAHVQVTFVHEGAGFKNSFGYFTWTAETVPQSAADVTLVPIFANTSYQGSGGGLQTGNTVQIGPFPPGTYVGFWVKANAWNSNTQTIGSGYWTHFTLPHLNTEVALNKRQHVAMFWHEETQKLIMGFEDINRETSWCDQDFNDLIFFASTDPVEAVDYDDFVTVDADYDADNDGVPDHSDLYPDDIERVSNRYYPAQGESSLLAFEDNFPNKGDYDFNDLVLTYSSQEVLNADGNLKELIMNMKVKAMGAMFHNGFAIQFPFNADEIESASLLINGVSSTFFPVEAGHSNETVINIMQAVQQHIDGNNFPNTLEGSSEKRGDRFELRLIFKTSVTGVSWPYNPFMFVNQNRAREVHLAGYQPTEFVNSSFFGTGDDVSVVGTTNTYKDVDGMPFAMLLPINWKWPEEFVDITNVYPKFTNWAETAGVEDLDWSDTKIDSLIWVANDAVPESDNFDNDSMASFWQDSDQGTRVSLIEEIDQKLKITSSSADIWRGTNNFAARYLSLEGDFDVSVKIESQDNTHPWAKAGIIIKENMNVAADQICFTGITPSNGFIFQYDWSGDGLINGHKGVYKATQNRDNYVRMVRSGNVITTYHRQDISENWVVTGSYTFTQLPTILHVGLFAVSHSYDYGTAVFDDFILSQ